MKKILTIIVGILLAAPLVFADCSESFSWLPNQEVDIAGYTIYYSLSSDGQHEYEADVGNPEPIAGRCNGTVTGLECLTQYFFVCVARDSTGRESGHSNRVVVITGDGAPAAPVNFRLEE